ncbi:hypothetical protein COCC4DRAFT_163026 [Bipolaris maydis ATCC 48331]|uniref:Uncharacterized protein n=2 Tax=Cochliobolus heterostrophus TaxID=5016 RepID=M2U248_COCH5|nr:uncharacterized protein COCC4DRAFT_163026 [Bipolaris maydis ATCC 48331]EMD92634.1 hypothetical protein COCHEDRAFT_1135430 [Bipolaris maydis C5]ENI08330.1 hypothetical protein COCC4DRAFT_163026 [Bipolaris maydis ATCC 48331]KAJ5022438.1 hypothetical protein J3E73DRAFT_240146 [Bipolaris maydis]
MSADDSLSTAEVLRRLKEEMAQQAPRDHKEHHAIETSLSNPYLQSDTKWGFVIVRASYGPSSDTLWAQFLDLFRANVEETLRLEDELDLLPRHEMTIIENEAALGGADSYAARRAFRAWVANDLPQRLRGSCLEELGGLAQILTTEWEREEAEVPTEEFTRDWDGGETNDDAEEVGWMYMDMTDYVTVYDRLTDAFAWQEYYQRPYKSYVENSESESD